ncbi:MAG: hemolysin family protein [Thermoguttaceae bacterium]
MIYLVLLGLFFTCFSSACAVSYREFSRHQLEELCEWWGTIKRLGYIIKNYERLSVAADTLRIVSVVVSFLAGFSCLLPNISHLMKLEIISPFTFAIEWAALVICGTITMMLVIVWIPTALAEIWATHLVLFTTPFWAVMMKPLFPLELVHRFFRVFFFRLSGIRPETTEEEQFEEEIRTIVTEGHREGLLEEDAREMIESVIELGSASVSEIMTPRTDMVSVSKDLSWDELLAFVVTSRHSRIPVFEDNRDNVIGILVIRDLIPEIAKPESDRKAWTELLRTPLFVPETKPVDKLLQEFQNSESREKENQPNETARSRHMHLAVVLDEYGGVAGLVSLEDILEEIVGEIIDEHDSIVENEEIIQVSPDVYEVLGKTHLDDINEQLNIELPEEDDFDTIAGFVFSTLGHVPKAGESLFFEHEGKKIKLTVLKATNRRIELIKIEKIVEEA